MQKQVQRKEEKKVNRTGIPDRMKERYEGLSGYSFDDVKIHYNSAKPAALEALAYTQGTDVHIGPGQEQHLEHELGHVIQQKAGIVRPTETINGMPVNTDPVLEQEADWGSAGNVSGGGRIKNVEVVQRYTMPEGASEEGAKKVVNQLYSIIEGKFKENKVDCEEKQIYSQLLILIPESYMRSFFAAGDIGGVRETAEEFVLEMLTPEKKDGYNEYLNKVLKRIDQGFKDINEDINYWKKKIEESPDDFSAITGIPSGTVVKSLQVEKIRLSGSDLHERGLGAVFVSFTAICRYMYFLNKSHQFEVVLKPDQRIIEESLLSDKSESLAEKFNSYTWIYNDEDISDQEKIQTIPMRTSSTYVNNSRINHGTIIKKIVGKELNESDSINEIASIKAIVFACLAGISDLHYENILYDKKGVPYFIDADVALNRRELGNVRNAKNQEMSGFSREISEFSIRGEGQGIKADIRAAFNGKYGRIVPLATTVLQRGRSEFVKGNRGEVLEKHKRELFESLENMGFNKKKKPYIESLKTQEDYEKGQLPLYIYYYSNGNVHHNGRVIIQGKKLDEIIDEALRDIITDE